MGLWGRESEAPSRLSLAGAASRPLQLLLMLHMLQRGTQLTLSCCREQDGPLMPLDFSPRCLFREAAAAHCAVANLTSFAGLHCVR